MPPAGALAAAAVLALGFWSGQKAVKATNNHVVKPAYHHVIQPVGHGLKRIFGKNSK